MNEYIPFAGPSNFSGTTENVALIDIMPLAELRRIYKDIKIVKYKTELVIGEKTPNKTLNSCNIPIAIKLNLLLVPPILLINCEKKN